MVSTRVVNRRAGSTEEKNYELAFSGWFHHCLVYSQSLDSAQVGNPDLNV
jgi:hypothetical protein